MLALVALDLTVTCVVMSTFALFAQSGALRGLGRSKEFCRNPEEWLRRTDPRVYNQSWGLLDRWKIGVIIGGLSSILNGVHNNDNKSNDNHINIFSNCSDYLNCLN